MQLATPNFPSGCSAWLALIFFQKYLMLNGGGGGDLDQWDRNDICGTRLDCW